MHISFIIPTRNRSQELKYSLNELSQIDTESLGDNPELILVDNGSRVPIDMPDVLPNGIRVVCIRVETNLGAGARNLGVHQAQGDWVIMLDDDSHLCRESNIAYLDQVDPNVAAVGGEIWLPDGSHEAGGLTEVVVGCGCAFRKNAFLQVGGYDNRFGYYAEEYDLCAKLIAKGYEVHHSKMLQFKHRKSSNGRDMNEILYRLVRNNGWVIQRYAPDQYREHALESMKKRYKQVAIIENALDGYQRGMFELDETISNQVESTLSTNQWARFTGAKVVYQVLSELKEQTELRILKIVGQPHGKGLETILRIAVELDFEIATPDFDDCTTKAIEVVGTLSPGPIADTLKNHPEAINFGCMSAETGHSIKFECSTSDIPLHVQ